MTPEESSPSNDSTKIPELFSLFWTLGNVIAGFAVLQSLAFSYVTLQAEWKVKVQFVHVLPIVTIMILLGVVLQVAAVQWCHCTSMKFWPNAPKDASIAFERVTLGRNVCVILFGIAC